MNKIPKALLDELLDHMRAYYLEGHKIDDYRAAVAVAHKIENTKFVVAFWMAWTDFASGCIELKRDVTNYEIYTILKILGWEVTDEDGNSD